MSDMRELPRARARRAARDSERAGDQARKAVVRAAKAVERAGLKVQWVRRLAKRLARLGPQSGTAEPSA